MRSVSRCDVDTDMDMLRIRKIGSVPWRCGQPPFLGTLHHRDNYHYPDALAATQEKQEAGAIYERYAVHCQVNPNLPFAFARLKRCENLD
jgi:hypothetical protein